MVNPYRARWRSAMVIKAAQSAAMMS
ncbi:MAG: hypothetical protein QOE61_3778, partial [Micromonosporaceae bacterium]|nr:hypothetical protein [Micromonosporaceae bacterium]